jgi:hypothetical protein
MESAERARKQLRTLLYLTGILLVKIWVFAAQNSGRPAQRMPPSGMPTTAVATAFPYEYEVW